MELTTHIVRNWFTDGSYLFGLDGSFIMRFVYYSRVIKSGASTYRNSSFGQGVLMPPCSS